MQNKEELNKNYDPAAQHKFKPRPRSNYGTPAQQKQPSERPSSNVEKPAISEKKPAIPHFNKKKPSLVSDKVVPASQQKFEKEAKGVIE